MEFQIKFETIPESLQKPFSLHFPSYNNGLVKAVPGGYVSHPNYALNGAERIFNIKLRSDDIWLHTFPRSGKQ